MRCPSPTGKRDQVRFSPNDAADPSSIQSLGRTVTSATDHRGHADAYAEYQKCFRRDYMEKVKGRSARQAAGQLLAADR